MFYGCKCHAVGVINEGQGGGAIQIRPQSITIDDGDEEVYSEGATPVGDRIRLANILVFVTQK